MSANNTVILIGRLTSDPRVSYSQGEKPCAIASFSLAVDRGDKNKTTDFINCKAIGNRGEFAEKYLKKGTKVVAKGYWQTGNYTNKEGVKVYTNECLCEDLTFAESKAASSESDMPNSLRDELPMMNTQAPPTRPATDANEFMPIPEGIDEYLPFAVPR